MANSPLKVPRHKQPKTFVATGVDSVSGKPFLAEMVGTRVDVVARLVLDGVEEIELTEVVS